MVRQGKNCCPASNSFPEKTINYFSGKLYYHVVILDEKNYVLSAYKIIEKICKASTYCWIVFQKNNEIICLKNYILKQNKKGNISYETL